MRRVLGAVVALSLLATMPANAGFFEFLAWCKPVVKVVPPPPAPKPAVPTGNGGTNWTLCPTPAGIVICAVTVGIVVHEIAGPPCASDSAYDKAHGYDQRTLWRPDCKWVNTVRVNG